MKPPGPDPSVLGLLADRLADAAADVPRLRLVRAGGAPPADDPPPIGPRETAVVLVGEEDAAVRGLAESFLAGCADGYLTVETASVARTATEAAAVDLPGVVRGLERCRALGARRVIVAPYLLFAGGALSRVWAEALWYAAEHPEVDVRCAEVVGGPEKRAEAVVERLDGAAWEPPAALPTAVR
jgi:sirohydrochlorin cobaltochelatase